VTHNPHMNERPPADEAQTSVHWATLGRVGPALLVIVAALITVYAIPERLVPWIAEARPWNPGEPVPFWNLLGRPFEAEDAREAEERHEEAEDFAREALAEAEPVPVERPEQPVVELDEGDRLPPYVPQPGDDKQPTRELELFTGHELDRFFESLARSDASVAGAVTRVVHWGDSAIGIDGITGAIRARMQARFGNSGHGFHLMAPPNTSYRHRAIDFETNGLWEQCFIIQNCKKDGRYGLGGATFWSYGGAQSEFEPHPERSSGEVDVFEVWYLAHPRGGKLGLRIDREDVVVVDTRAEEVEDRWHRFELERGPHKLRVRANPGGQSRVYGVTIERDVPGVVWDGLALVGAFTKRMLNYNPEHLADQLEHREAKLAVLMFGGNDMIREGLTQEQYEKEYREVLQLIRGAKPDMDCLVMAPLDHGERKGVRIVSRPIVPILVEAQRAAAKAEGCAFFDTYMAMGGEGSAGRWYKQEPRLIGGDLGHATMKGHVVIGEMVYRALLHEYVAYRKRDSDE
jgi:lysophospholipase L1-like esterase